MTAGTAVPSRPLRAARGPGLSAGRLLRLELRRSTMLWMLPLLALLLAVTELRNDFSHPPLWAVRSIDVQQQLQLTGAIVAAVAAWTAGRDGRRHVTELLATTARPRWVRQLASWAAVTTWAILFYAACVAVVFVVTARQATWGGPIWWLPGVGAAGVVAFSAVGFTIGAFFPGRFVAPLVAIGAALAPQVGVLALQQHHVWGRVSPVGDATVVGTGTFFPFHAGLSMVQIMFLAGLVIAALGGLALPAAAGSLRLRRAGAVIALAGLATAVTAVALADTARQEAAGIIIPSLHTAASDKLISYRPACDSSSAIPVCLHPAFRALLPALAAAVGPVLSQVAGLPGAPAGVQLSKPNQQDVSDNVIITESPTSIGILGGPAISGTPPVLYLSPYLLLDNPGTSFSQGLRSQVAIAVIQTMIYGRPATGQPAPAQPAQSPPAPGQPAQSPRVPSPPAADPAQQAIAAAIVKVAGVPLLTAAAAAVGQPGDGLPGPAPGSPAYAAAVRFAALPAAARHAWLATHLAALRAGRLTVAEIP